MRAACLLLALAACGISPSLRLSLNPIEVGATPDVRLVPQLPTNSRPSKLALTDDGKLALVGGDDGSLAIWQLEQRTLLGVLFAHEAEVVTLATAGYRAWSIGRKNTGQMTLCEIDLNRVSLRACQKLGPGNVEAASISPDGSRAAVVLVEDPDTALQSNQAQKRQQWLVMIDLLHWKIDSSRALKRSERVNALAFSPDGKTLASIGDANLVLMDAGGKPRRQVPLDGVAITFGASGVLVGRADQSLELRRTDTGKLIHRRIHEHHGGLISSAIDLQKRVSGVAALNNNQFIVSTEHITEYRATLVDMATKANTPSTPYKTSTKSILLLATNKTKTRLAMIIDSDLVSSNSFWSTTPDRIALSRRGVTAAAFTQRGLWIGATNSLAYIDLATAVVETHKVPGVIEAIADNGRFAIVTPAESPPEIWQLTNAPVRVRVLEQNTRYRFCVRQACKLVSYFEKAIDEVSGELNNTDHGQWESALAAELLTALAKKYYATIHGRLDSVSLRITAKASSRDGTLSAAAQCPLLLERNGNASKVADCISEQTLMVLQHDTDVNRLLFRLNVNPYTIGALAFTPNARSLIAGARCEPPAVRTSCNVWRIDLATRRMHRLGAHLASVSSISVSPDGQAAVTISVDGTARIWRLDGSAAVSFVLDGDNWIMYADDVFDASRRGGTLVAAVRGNQAFPLEQLAAVANLPDQLIARLGSSRTDIRQYFAYRHAVRTAALGLAASSPGHLFDAGPQVTIDHLRRDGKFIELTATLVSPEADLARYQIWVNQVPILPVPGGLVRGKRVTIVHRIELTPGDNRIEVGAYSSAGVESLRAMQLVSYEAPDTGQLYVVALGVSRYRDQALELGLADRDARDIAAVFGKFPRAHVLQLTNEQVTSTSLADVRAFLKRATVDDTVVVFIAGHGILSPDARAEFLFVPYEFDRAHPRETAIPFSALEGLVEGIAARRRLLLIDSCVSGDRDEGTRLRLEREAAGTGNRARMITLRGAQAVDVAGPRLPREFLLDRDRLIFQDGTRGTGVAVLSSSRWNELSYERDDWGNGAFTAEIVRALGDPATDANHDQRVSLDELVRAVQRGVTARTGGLQHPTLRADNLDAGIWFPASSPR